jgi:hypothetical protein
VPLYGSPADSRRIHLGCRRAGGEQAEDERPEVGLLRDKIKQVGVSRV